MFWLIAHMWILLFTAFMIGVGAGWWIWGQRKSRDDRHAEPQLGTLEADGTPETTAAAEKP